MLPGVVIILLGLAIWTATQPGTAAGYAPYLSFDADYPAANFLSVIGPAAGQALFTLSLGAGVMLTYPSYLDDNASLPRDTLVIAVSNTFIGVLTGLVVIPLLFSQGVDPEWGGPSALFVALATAFATLPGGSLVATAFLPTVLVAAVTSGISLLETPVATLVDSFGVPRHRATVLVSVLFAATGSGLALTSSVFQFVSGTLADLLLTVGLFVFTVIVGWLLRGEALAKFRAGTDRFECGARPCF